MKRLFLTLLITLSVTGCIQTNPSSSDTFSKNDISIISPSGAPCLALYNHINNNQVTINTVPANVMAQLLSNNYDVVISEFYNGSKLIKKNNADFFLAKIITGGNLFLVGINKENGETPKTGDYVVSFNQGSIPDLAYKSLYKDGGATVEYVASNSEIIPVLKNGIHAGNKVDYVVIAEPALTTVMKSLDQSKCTITSLREEYGAKFKTEPYIPQAGLFINKTQYASHKTVYDEFIQEISLNIDLAVDNPLKVKEKMDVYSLEEQKTIFSFNSNVMLEVQQNNGFGLIKSNININIEEFINNVTER